MRQFRSRLRPVTLLLFLATGWFLLSACGGTPSSLSATPTPEPIVPTRTPQTIAVPSVTPELADEITAPPTIRATAAPTKTPRVAAINLPAAELARFGVAGPVEYVMAAAVAGLPMGATLNWRADAEPPVPPGVAYWQMLRLSEEGIRPALEDMETIVSARPGAVWLIGNEPDVPWQDGISAEQYAELYHDAYTFIKGLDPTAVIGAGGISMPSPLRLAYLDSVLQAYQAKYGTSMPTDLWSVHAFTLREEHDSWGIGIPPGMDGVDGQLFEIDDHADLDIFIQHIRDFRTWMADNGYQGTPLAVTEFGILLPSDYGFPEELVADYMRQTIDFMRTAADENGYSEDNNRLVQHWFWYSLYDDGAYPTGDLYEPATGELTNLGNAYRDYVASLGD